MSAIANTFVYVEVEGKSEQVRYDQFVQRLFKVDTFNEMVHHAKGGVCEEAGELSDALKRHITYHKPLTGAVEKDGQTIMQKIIEEVGDTRFYLQAVMNLYGITESQILQANADKLSKRYKDLVYTDVRAQDRADKV